jgi:TrmH RNA methyltransferase
MAQRAASRHGEPSRNNGRKLLRVAGLPAVSALFATAPQRVERLFFDERTKALAGALCEQLERMRKPYRLVGSDELARVAGSVMHGGIVALAEPRPLPALDPADAAAWAREGKPLLLLDGIGNPHNLGAIARTAAFFGVPRIVVSDHPSQAGPSDASYRVAEGGLDHVELYRGVRFAHTLQRLSHHFHVLGTAADKGLPIASLRRRDRPFALVLGNEEHGLPLATLRACEAIVSIPGAGLIQSLNVAASAAILMHTLMRQADEGR